VAKTNKVIITCAVTGSIHTPSMSPHLPITAHQIADAAIDAAEAGAAVVHLHARNSITPRLSANILPSLDHCEYFLYSRTIQEWVR
jgi:uncharacterized protein (DUF849 family)